MSPIERILDLARWAPSGDNTQPWRFEVIDAHNIVVHGFDTRERCVYDLDGHPSQLSLGALLENIAIAASLQALRANCRRRVDMPETRPTFDVCFTQDAALQPDPLASQIMLRSVQRRALRTRRLSVEEKRALEQSLGTGYSAMWLEGLPARLRATRLMFANAKLRLVLPEAYVVHRDSIQWNARYSEDRVPDQALGIDPLTIRLMRWVMRNWRRVSFFNRFLAGTWAPRIQMELIPGLACAAHFVIKGQRPAATIDDYVSAGRAVQRFWLTATRLGLQLQPEMTPLIFSRYAREGQRFSSMARMHDRARALERMLVGLAGETDSGCSMFMGRIGAGNPARSRSLRRPLAELISPASSDAALAVPERRG